MSSFKRIVPGFSVQAYQNNSVTSGPPKMKKKKKLLGTIKNPFSMLYGVPGFPFSTGNAGCVRWFIPLSSIDYNVYLPLLFHGIRESTYPYDNCAALALRDILDEPNCGSHVLEALPKIILPIRKALDTERWIVIIRTFMALQKIVTCDSRIGEALIPFFRYILPPFNRYLFINVEVLDDLNRKNVIVNVMDICRKTLNLLEIKGGLFAYTNIKNIIPTYEKTITLSKSCQAQ
ncbi:parkin coregulated gene protein homolog [Daktulosphaira vitifoliae]|uniref:parkin coregulated gene protein homolog n=1 Tax=Daktulosphaira vitifoliae TaxID=58002 RepID=UPI0021A9FB06|nr:parkin coregulated gene protein homolog [Daktulosphaira vitifoliae]